MPDLSSAQNLTNVTETIVLAVVFVCVALTIYLIGRIVMSPAPREDARLREIRHDSPFHGEPEPGLFGSWAPALASQIPETEAEQKEFRIMLRQAGIYNPRASETIYAARFLLLVTPIILAGILAIILDSKWTIIVLVSGLIISAILVIVPRLYVYFRRRRHMQKIRAGLADVIDMLGMCVSGGLPLGAGLEQVARRMTTFPECANELLLLKRQAEIGGIKRALADFTERVNLPEASQLASLLLRNTNMGTELVGSLAAQADHLRLARRQAALTEANKTPVKLVLPIMFCFAPAVLILLTAPAIMQLRKGMQDFIMNDSAARIQKSGISNQPLLPSDFSSLRP